jgi:hypothetical protein
MVAFLIGTRRCIAFRYVAAAIEYLSGEVVLVAADKGTYQGEIQYVVTSAAVSTSVEPEEEEVKPAEWFLPPHPDVLANLLKMTAKSTDKVSELLK